MALEATDAYETIHTDTALRIVRNYIKRYGSFAPQAVCPSPAEPAEPAAEPAAERIMCTVAVAACNFFFSRSRSLVFLGAPGIVSL